MRHVMALVNCSVMPATDLLEGRCHILQERQAVGTLGGLGRPCRMPAAEASARSRATLVPVGWAWSHVATGSAARSASTSRGHPRSRSTMRVPERWPFRHAQASMPRISGAGPSGRHTRRTRCRRGWRLPGTPWRAKCRAPAAPPRTSPGSACVVARLVVVRAYRGATVGRRSAQVWRRHVQGGHRKRRTVHRSARGAVAQGTSARVRGSCPGMRGVGWRQSGQGEWGESMAATRMRGGASMLRDCNVIQALGGSKCAPRSSHVTEVTQPFLAAPGLAMGPVGL
jgi:hypothetical protein